MAKQKEVFASGEVSHIWANQQQNYGRSTNSVFFSGDTIYSYGYHFPIATHHKGIVLFTLDSYSSTTAKHIHNVRSAVSHKDLVYCLNPKNASENNHDGNVNYWINNIESIAKNKLPKAKKPQIYFAQIENERTQLNKYLDFFKLKLKKEQKKLIEFSNEEEFLDNVKKAAKLQYKKERAIDKKATTIFNKWYDAWHNNTTKTDFAENITSEQQDLLRFKERRADETWLRVLDKGTTFSLPKTIETSKGIELPTDVAKRYYDFYKRILANGGCNGNCNYKMLDYNVTLINKDFLIIGCHKIPTIEITQIATQLNW
jgi:hypothetical protein